MKSLSFYIKLFLPVILIGVMSCRKVNEDCNLNDYPNAPSKSWFKSYSGSESESHGHFILECADGGFLQIGETGNLQNQSKILVVKTNSSGNLLWKQELSNGNYNLGNSAIEIEDGYVVCGSQNGNSSLIKLDKTTGNIIFDKTYNNGGTDSYEHLASLGNRFISVGYVNASDTENTFYTEGQGYITLLDSLGNKLIGKNINCQLSHAYRIKEYNDYYFISGLTANAQDYGLMKIDSELNVIWFKTFGGDKSDHCFGLDINADGDIFLTGHTLSGTENWDTYTIKLNYEGQIIWDSKQGNPRGFAPKYIHDEAWGIKVTSDGGCIVAAGTGDEYGIYKRRCGNEGDNSNKWHVYLVKYNATGNIEWQQTYGSEGDWAGEDLVISSDGSVLVAVDNGEFGFLKLN